MLGTKAKTKPATLSTNQSKHQSHSISPSAAPSEKGLTCVIAEGTHISGQFSSTENVRIDGSVKGEFVCQHKLVMGETGFIDGKITTHDAVIMGKIEGEITCKGTLHLKSTAFIKGIITSKFMIVDEGAKYNGECNIGKNK